MVLPSAGYDVLTAANGREGLILANDLRPDLIIADHRMPELSGLEMLAALRTQGLDIPFILMTAEGSEALAVEALRLGVRDYLIKPFDPDDLLQTLERVLREHWTRQITQNLPARLLDTNVQLEQRLRELDTLFQTSKRITSLLDLEPVLDQIVKSAVLLTGADQGTLMLVDPATGGLYLYASTDAITPRQPVSDRLAQQVVETRKALIFAGDDLLKIKTHHLARDVVYLPLLLQDEVLGVLGVTSYQTSGKIEQHRVQLLGVLADFAAIALDNARLYTATQHERDTLDTILRDAEDIILAVDADNRLIFCNPAASAAFGLGTDTACGQPIGDVVEHPELLDLFDQAGKHKSSRSGEITLDGGSRTLNAHLTVIERVGKVAVMQDITHLKELDRIKSEFVTTVSHDLRSPLTAILAYVELITRSGPLNEQQQEYVRQIHVSVRSITGLISDLLELGKIEAGFDQSRELTRLEPIIQQAIDGQRPQLQKKAIDLRVSVAEHLPPLLGNPLRIRQMVNNLLENAIKYTPEHGKVRVSLEADAEFLVLRVFDTGIGIPKQDQPYIFDKFYRTEQAISDFAGTGLGLSIVKGIVDQHSGRIWVESQVGKGSVFTVMLPSYNHASERSAAR
jgi:two-component system NtrC family sensor kinase